MFDWVLFDVVSWNAMLGGFAMHGHGKEALAHFEHTCVEGIKMNGITFVCLLSMAEHYACIVDLLGHAGCLHEAEDLIHTMSCTPSASVWKSFAWCLQDSWQC